MTNAARHSGAASVVLDLRADGDRGVLLRVEDDGEGLGGAPEGAGIRGMRERALLVGGALDLRTGPGGGTRLDLRVPTVHASLAGADRPVEERP
ncbi:sensor histidine kinase [Actinomadura nitritigenes]|uniref:sensor histidine kinase n=1 Tax=Actinomadura nitritigenes TaxID=134602 RepID=UPI0036A0D901